MCYNFCAATSSDQDFLFFLIVHHTSFSYFATRVLSYGNIKLRLNFSLGWSFSIVDSVFIGVEKRVCSSDVVNCRQLLAVSVATENEPILLFK